MGSVLAPPGDLRESPGRKRKQTSDHVELTRLLAAHKSSWASRARRPVRELITRAVLTAGGTPSQAELAGEVAGTAAAAAAVATCAAGHTGAETKRAGHRVTERDEYKLLVACLACHRARV